MEMTAFTAKNYTLSGAPKRIGLLGDKKRPESAQHIIEFPGGAIEVSRCSDGSYWAHIIVHQGEVLEETKGRTSARGKVIGSRVQRDSGLADIEDTDTVTQIAVLIAIDE
jgi:hypothetical protein